MNLKSFIVISAAAVLAASCCAKSVIPSEVTLSKATLEDKIRGGWAGQIIGCTYGGPTEFQHSFIIDERIDIPWSEDRIQHYFDKGPGLYDDIYMDLTFVDVFDKEGLDAPVESFAKAFAYAKYPLWHANAQGRYNIMNGIMPPASGSWLNNPHADDIDFEIEADYAGLMSPGMINSAAHFCDGIGHMMNSGDGYYAGVYMASMYSLAFVCDDIKTVVADALKVIPAESLFAQAMSDVIGWYKKYPGDWKQTWFEVNKKYGYEYGCPDGVRTGFNIDGLMNSAYVIIGLLYGEQDFAKTLEISTRCGQDSDCNPASAGGILATMLGYNALDEVWTKPLDVVADRPFEYTDISFNKACELSMKQALQVIVRAGGSVSEDNVTIKVQAPEVIPFEQNFEGLEPSDIIFVRDVLANVKKVDFNGSAVVVRYDFLKTTDFKTKNYVAEVEAYLDGEFSKKLVLPADGNGTSPEFYYNYQIPAGDHSLTFKWLNPVKGIDIRLSRVLVYKQK